MPLDDQAFYVTNDTPQKRLERETNIAISIPVPDAVSPQEMVEYGTALRAVFNLQRIHADPGSRTIFIRDAISRVRPAVLQLYQLMGARAEVDLEIELMDVSSGTSTTLGMNPPTLFPVNNVGGYWQAARSLAGGVGSNFALAITGARLLASSSQSDSRTLFRTRIRASNQTPATAKIGQRYPIISAVIGNIPGFTSFEVPPQVQFEDLGLDLKVTPRIHGADEVSLEIETEFKTLGSESFNGVPTINNRKIASQVRLRAGEWAAVGGLLTADQARTLAGLAGSTSIPFLGFLLGNQTFETNRTQVLLVIKPRIVIPGAPVWATQEVYVGSEQRPLVPL
jgi:general secretion pathway protein D